MKKTKISKTVARLISILFSLAILTSVVCLPVSAKVDDIASAKNGVVLVVGEEGQGTGFAVGKTNKPVQWIVTACHVVAKDYGTSYMSVPNTATVYFSAAAGKAMSANVYYYNADVDIAVLKLPETTTEREALTLCPSEDVDLSDTVAALGYPGNGTVGSDYVKYDVSDIVVTKGGIKKTDRENGRDAYLLDLVLEPGNSGGPVVNSKGEVIGIATDKWVSGNYELGSSYAVAIDELIRNIDTDTIPITLHTNLPSPLIMIGGGVLLLIIILLIVFLLLRKRGENSDNDIIHGSDESVKPVKKGARVIALNGALNGKKYSINGDIKIGRDSSACQIAYSETAPGISGRHCQISFDGKVFYITDLGSSYGTFLSNGTKLKPNTPQMLKSGEQFYLASPENTFEVRF